METQKISDAELIEQAISFYKETCKKEKVTPSEPDPDICIIRKKRIFLVNSKQGIAIVRFYHGQLHFKLNGKNYKRPLQAENS